MLKLSFSWPPVTTELERALRELHSVSIPVGTGRDQLVQRIQNTREGFERKIIETREETSRKVVPRAAFIAITQTVTVLTHALFRLTEDDAVSTELLEPALAIFAGGLSLWPKPWDSFLSQELSRLGRGFAKMAQVLQEATSSQDVRVKERNLRRVASSGRLLARIATSGPIEVELQPIVKGQGAKTKTLPKLVPPRPSAPVAKVVDAEEEAWERYEASVARDVELAERLEWRSPSPIEHDDLDDDDGGALADLVAPPAESAPALELAIASALARAGGPRVEPTAPDVVLDPTQALFLAIARVTPSLNGSRIVARIPDVIFPAVNGDWDSFLRRVAKQLSARWSQEPVRLELRGHIGTEKFGIEVEKKAGQNTIAIVPLPPMGLGVRGHVNRFLPRELSF